VLAVTAASFAVALTACGSSNDTSTATSASTAAAGQAEPAGIQAATETVAQYTKPQPPLDIPALSRQPPTGKRVNLVYCTLPTCQINAGKQAFERLGWQAKINGFDIAKGPQSMVAAFDAALADKPDYIMVSGSFPWTVVAKQLAQAKADGIGVVGVTGTGVSDGIVGCIACAPQLEATGKMQVDIALADAQGKTSMVYVNDPVVIGGVQELDGARAEAKKDGDGSTFDKLDLSVIKTPADNAARVVSYLQSHPDVKYLAASINDLIVGVPAALAQAGLADRVKLIGTTPQLPDLDYIRQGRMLAAVAHENGSAQWRAIDLFARMSVDDALPKDMVEPVGWHQIIDKSNVTQGLPVPADYQQTYATAWHVNG
jgi:hypothetical protein